MSSFGVFGDHHVDFYTWVWGRCVFYLVGDVPCVMCAVFSLAVTGERSGEDRTTKKRERNSR